MVGNPGRTEREIKFTIRGDGLSDPNFKNARLASEIQQALAAVIGAVSWQAPPLMGALAPLAPTPAPSPVPYQLGPPSNPVFLDTYYDTWASVNYLSDTVYRFRMRFTSVDAIRNLRPQRLEYHSHFDQSPFVDGYRSRTESRLELPRDQTLDFARLNALVRNAQTGMDNSAVMAPSSGLVDFYRRTTQPNPHLSYLPNLVLETDRGRIHFLMDITNLQIGHSLEEVFIITMDTARVYLAADYHRWLKWEMAAKPAPLRVLNEVEVEFEQGTSHPLDAAIAQAQSAGDFTRFIQLTQVVNAFLADQRTVMETILERFAELCRQQGNGNFLVCAPDVNSKYPQAFASVFSIRGDAN